MGSEAQRSGTDVADVVLGVGAGAWHLARWASRPLRTVGGGVLGVVVSTARDAGVLDRGTRARLELESAGAAALQALTIRVLDVVLAAPGLTDLVGRHIELDTLVAKVDLDAAVMRVDLVGIVRGVIAEIDIPQIVRDSTGALSSDAVRTVRAEGMLADDAIAALVDRVLNRRKRAQPVLP